MSGTIDVNLDYINTTINQSLRLGADVTTGVADQGTGIGQALGVTLIVVFISGAILAALGVIFIFLGFFRNLKGAASAVSRHK